MKRLIILLFIFLNAYASSAIAQSKPVGTEQATPPLLPIKSSINGLKGYADINGKQIIKPQFKLAGWFSEGLAPIVDLKNRIGYINSKGRMVLKLKVVMISGFSEGLAAAGIVKDSSLKYGYIDRRGQFVIKPQFDEALPFTEGIAPVMVKGKWGYINRSGQEVAKPQFEVALLFSEGLAAVLVDDKWGYVDKTGKFVIQPQFDDDQDMLDSGSFSEGLAAVPVNHKRVLSNGLVEVSSTWGYINKAGEWVIKPQFSRARGFSEGLAGVEIDGKWGYIDKNGNLIIKPQFSRAGDFSGGLAKVRVDINWGYIDRTGKIVIQPQFFHSDDYDYGVALVETSDFSIGFIDKSGKMLVRWTECQAYHCSEAQILRNAGVSTLAVDIYGDDDGPRLIPVEIRSKPTGAKVYVIPVHKWNKEKDPINNQQFLERYELPDGTTNVDTTLDEQVFIVVFDLNGKRVSKHFDVISSKKNKVEAEIR